MASSSLRSRTEPGSGELLMGALPAKELCRLRVVCRPWRSLLSDPRFIAAHTSCHPEPLIVASHDTSCECHDEGRVLCDIMDSNGRVIKRILATGNEWMMFAHLEFVCIETRWTKNCHMVNLATGDVFSLPEELSEEHAEREQDFYEFRATVRGNTRCFVCLIMAYSATTTALRSCVRSSRLMAVAVLDGEVGRPLQVLFVC
ncbi:hypothetical protein BS78_05G105300 [Paspalum vaginatum]|nr:hypothetical protein BS78_05G105300 [Paspalum vaginatum]